MKTCTLQLYFANQWHDVAVFQMNGAANLGHGTPSHTGYLTEHVLRWQGRCDAHACSASFPVSLVDRQLPSWPAFLVDLLPQGYGRRELLRQLNLPSTTQETGDWPLLCAGAGNPIGNLRVKEAWERLQTLSSTSMAARGFTHEEVAGRREPFLEYLARQGLLVAGSSGAQGEWPKILLTEADDGLLYLDHSLADARARQHWLVKFSWSGQPDMAEIFQAEAPYMRLAQHLGLRVHGALVQQGGALFIPRFDRAIRNGIVLRHGQESMASLCEKTGFGLRISHNEICRRLARVVTHAETEIIEYLRRDVANMALGNKDNHARNTALMRRENGDIALTPLFDFAPMFLHPDGIARTGRWERDDGDWRSAVTQAAQAGGLDEIRLRQGVATMAPALFTLPEKMREEGISTRLIQHLVPGIEKAAEALQTFHAA